jgi:hypothetical protein
MSDKPIAPGFDVDLVQMNEGTWAVILDQKYTGELGTIWLPGLTKEEAEKWKESVIPMMTSIAHAHYLAGKKDGKAELKREIKRLLK